MSMLRNFRVQMAQPAAATTDGDATGILNRWRELVIGGYNWLTNAVRTEETNPLSRQFVEQELASAVAITVAGSPFYFPSAAGMTMAGYKDLGVQFTITTGATAADTINISLEATDDTSAVPTWPNAGLGGITLSGYDLVTGAMVAGPLTATSPGGGGATPLTGIVDWDMLNVRLFRFALTATGHDGVLTRLHIRLKAH